MCRIQFKIPSLSVRLCFIFFPLAPDVMNTICKIVLHLLCTQRGQSVCFAARLQHNSLLTPLTTEYETCALYQATSVTGPVECSWHAGVFLGLVKRQTLRFQTDILRQQISDITVWGVLGLLDNFHGSFCFPQFSAASGWIISFYRSAVYQREFFWADSKHISSLEDRREESQTGSSRAEKSPPIQHSGKVVMT